MKAGDTLRVAILLGRYPPEFSGHGIQIQRLLPYLQAAGVEPEVVCFAPPLELAPKIEPDAVAVHRILSPDARGRRGQLERVLQLRRFLRREHGRFDAVHAAVLGWTMFVNAPLVARLGLPMLFEMVLLGADDPLTVQGYPLGRFKFGRLRRAVREWVGLTSAFRESVAAVGIPPERFHTVYGGVDVDTFRPADAGERRALRRELDLPEDARVVVSIGALVPRKGMDRLVRAFAAARPVPGRDVLVLVGPASEAEGVPARFADHPEALRRQIREAGLEGQVRLVGRKSAPERYARAADLFAFLSHQEGLGYVIIEAMSCGIPVLVSPLDGIGHELVRHGETGFVVDEPDDDQAVGSRLRQLLDDEERRRRLGVEARCDVVARFSMQARARALAKLYAKMVAESHL